MKPFTPILRPAFVTLVAFVAVLGYGVALFGWLFPSTMMSFCGKIGADNAVAMYAERQYNANKTRENLYTALDAHIITKNHKKVITYTDKMFELPADDYVYIINMVNEYGTTHGVFAWTNEDNRIKSAYITALLKTKQNTRAQDQFETWMYEKPVNIMWPNFSFEAFLANKQQNEPINADIERAFVEYYTNFKNAFVGQSGEWGIQFLKFAEKYLGINNA